MDIRLANENDAKELENFLVQNVDKKYGCLARSYVGCAFSNAYRRPHFIIATDHNEIIGTAAFSEELFTVDTWGISWVHVDPQKRGVSIGQKLIENCLSHIGRAAQKTVSVILNTYPDKTGLYDKLGFRKAGQDHDGGWFMIKILSAPDQPNPSPH